jgi:predicted Zn-dependent protease
MPVPPQADTAFRCADAVRSKLAAPWDIFGERIRRYELHFVGKSVEMVRGPIRIEGVGIRVFRPVRDELGVGFASGSALAVDDVQSLAEKAEGTSPYATFPAASVELPNRPVGSKRDLEIRDPGLWDHPEPVLEDFVHQLLEAFDGNTSVVPSFGSVRATLVESTLANSSGLADAYSHTYLEFEIALKSFGGPEGAAPGEYWVNRVYRKARPNLLVAQVPNWARLARDSRIASPTPTGKFPVFLPAAILSEILPPVLGYRGTGAARIRDVALERGIQYAPPDVSIADDGMCSEGILTAPFDDEGSATRRIPLIDHGSTQMLLYDALHGAAFGEPSTGSGRRGGLFGPDPWIHFSHPPAPKGTTLMLDGGEGGSDEELIESVSDGILVEQLGWAFPDPVAGNFGGELRIGYRIRGGKRAEPIRGGTVGGLVLGPPGKPTLLNSIRGLGTRPELNGQLRAPACVTTGLTVAGAS